MLEVTGLSDEKFGKAFDYSKYQIFNYRTGKTKVPDDLVYKLAKAIEVSPEDFASKDLSKQIKSMILVVNSNELPENDEKDAIIKQQADLIESLKEVIQLQKQLLVKK